LLLLETARSFWKAPLPDLHRAAFSLCLPALRPSRRTGWPPGQPRRLPAAGLSWGQDRPEPKVVVPVRRVVVVAVRRPAVVRVVVPTAAPIHTVRALWPPPPACAAPTPGVFTPIRRTADRQIAPVRAAETRRAPPSSRAADKNVRAPPKIATAARASLSSTFIRLPFSEPLRRQASAGRGCIAACPWRAIG